MDLTGSDSNCTVSNLIYKVYKYGQRIDFETPVYADSIKVYYASGGISGQLLTLNTDYIIPDDFVTTCDNDYSAARLRDSTFRANFCSGIEMIHTFEDDDSDFSIAISYQRLYPSQIQQSYVENTALNFTPEMLSEMVAKIAQHDALLNRVSSTTALTTGDAKIYEVDTTGENPANLVEDEEHVVSTANGRVIVHPQAGSFYADSIKVTYNEVELVKGTDYYLVGMDEAATKATSALEAVWHFIAIVTPVEGTVKITYQAFGGEPTVENYRLLLENLSSIISYLNDAQTVTTSSIGSTKVISSLFDRITTLESEMRRLHGGVNYGDVTDGKTILMKVYASESGVNWFTIASLYKAGGSSTVSTADTFTFKLQSLLSHFQFTCSVAVDLENTDGDVFNCQVLVDNYPKGYTAFSDYSAIADIIRPQLRVVWNSQEKASGCYLQLGLDLKTMNKETFQIEDISGQESEWVLIDEIDELTYPANSDFVLPDGSSTWSSLLDSSKSESMLIPFHKGHLAWVGDLDLNREIEGWQNKVLTDSIIAASENVDISRITKMRLDIKEEEGLEFAVDIPFAQSAHLKGHATFTHQDEPAYINAEVYKDASANIIIALNFNVLAGLESNKLTVKDIVFFS